MIRILDHCDFKVTARQNFLKFVLVVYIGPGIIPVNLGDDDNAPDLDPDSGSP